ncbi:DUF6287 domain-containing protein [Streptococcus suis]|uniref:DUF6287 domain-containing protein n=1 Tax=Streptococcus suis TaxID=1307 RepID=UPI001ABE7362|nr:hypothetical protein [Streptococcus suis]
MKRVVLVCLLFFLVGCQSKSNGGSSSSQTLSTSTESSSDTIHEDTNKSVYDSILDGDLSLFSGEFSTQEFNQVIADSNFTYGGYTREDYINQRTSVFPRITETGFWNGITSHGSFEIKTSDLPQKIDGYYLVNLYGTNSGAADQMVTFYLVPPNVKGPTGITSSEKTIFQKTSAGLQQLIYQKVNWWEEFQAVDTEADLNIQEINNGNFASLAGTWENGRGGTITIYEDGSTSFGVDIVAVQNSDVTSKIPYVLFDGVAIGMFKIGFSNPAGDRSDTTKARLVISHSAWDYDPDLYYYRK